jgi:hypothetical protein
LTEYKVKMELLDLSACTTNDEVSDLVIARVKSFKLEDLTATLAKNFVFHEEATRKIYTALAIGDNSILYGPGGFGKSDIVVAVCKELGLPVVCKTGYEGMKPEELLGVPNMAALLEESKYETAFENSVFSKPGILILEEFFDCDPSTAAALKDVLTARGHREGDGKKESLISSVIICGNKSPDEVSTSESTRAFYKDRFPIRYNMVWPNFAEECYMSLYRVHYGEDGRYEEHQSKLLLVAKLCAGTGHMVSPRIALKGAKVTMDLGVEYLDTVSDIDSTLVVEMKEQVERDAVRYKETEVLDRVERVSKGYIDESREILTQQKYDYINYKLTTLLNYIKDYTVSDDNVLRLTQLKSILASSITRLDELRFRDINTEEAEKEAMDAIFNYTTS